MIDKQVGTPEDAVADIKDGARIFVGGFGGSGRPNELIEALVEKKLHHLTIVSNNTVGAVRLITEEQVDRIICSFPLGPGQADFREAMERKGVALELIPQGTLAERIRAAAAGLGGVLTPTGVGTPFASGKQTIALDGKNYLLEPVLTADFALVKGWRGDRWGNLSYRHAARNFNPIMAMAARSTIAQVQTLVPSGLDPDSVQTPGIFVDKILECKRGE